MLQYVNFVIKHSRKNSAVDYKKKLPLESALKFCEIVFAVNSSLINLLFAVTFIIKSAVGIVLYLYSRVQEKEIKLDF